MPLKTTSIPELTSKEKVRFWAKVDKGEPWECWEWAAGKTGAGYGEFNLRGRIFLASRVSYFLAFGDIPEGYFCLHSCDNPPCCNPAHFFLGTDQDNANDKYKKGRGCHLFGESHPNSKLTESKVLEIRRSALPQKKLAEKFGVSVWAIKDVIKRRNWAHV